MDPLLFSRTRIYSFNLIDGEPELPGRLLGFSEDGLVVTPQTHDEPEVKQEGKQDLQKDWGLQSVANQLKVECIVTPTQDGEDKDHRQPFTGRDTVTTVLLKEVLSSGHIHGSLVNVHGSLVHVNGLVEGLVHGLCSNNMSQSVVGILVVGVHELNLRRALCLSISPLRSIIQSI